MNKKYILVLLLACFSGSTVLAQTSQTSLWGAWFINKRLSPNWGIGGDVQVRSADKVDYLRNILIRPQVNYYFNNNRFASVGYTYASTYGRNAVTSDHTFRLENRTWEQFTLIHKLCANSTLTHRFRLEQRYMGDSADGVNDSFFAQRFRYFVRTMVPFKKDSVFVKGAYLAVIDEVFANIQNKEKVNNHLFDQNRAFIAIGYRLSKAVDVEESTFPFRLLLPRVFDRSDGEWTAL
ncbi:MAG: DUF2490 domain-containing protein [Sphingobacteriales bacterium]|nr:MAG: DUF2490 domain-containing protein [Sphingobacteriales bacterium]